MKTNFVGCCGGGGCDDHDGYGDGCGGHGDGGDDAVAAVVERVEEAECIEGAEVTGRIV